MAEFYFTYGTDEKFPFFGGWTVVEAKDRSEACRLFRAVHPDNELGFMNCASVYAADQFAETRMAVTGNFDKFEHERISYNRK